MGHKFADIAFTEQVKQVQKEQNSRDGYASMSMGEDFNYLLSQREADFISARDSFYMASVSETDWPYVQHRGGPVGFMKILDAKTIGFADYNGNRQYVSTGNFRKNDRVALFFMDYLNKTRLKLLGRVKEISNSDQQTISKLENPDYRATIERGFIISVEAFDWNCPKYITPRYSEPQVKTIFEQVIHENETLRKQLTDLQNEQSTVIGKQMTLGEGALALKITGIRQLANGIRAYELRDINHKALNQVTAGSHLQVPVQLSDNKLDYRHYSICSNPSRTDIYEIAVLHEQDGKGGSNFIHQHYQLGMIINCHPVENHFELKVEKHQQGAPAVFIAGGIGITPIKAMVQSCQSKDFPFTLHYAGKSTSKMAFLDRLTRELSGQLHSYFSNIDQRLNLTEIINNADENTIFYLCGPNRLIDDFSQQAQALGIDKSRIQFERFNKTTTDEAKAITVNLKRSNKTIEVSEEQSILDALIEADIPVPYSCTTGICKTCVTKVTEGEPLHLDDALSQEEQEQNLFCPCVSRAKTSHLTIDL